MRDIFNKYAIWLALLLFLAISCIALYGFDATYELLPTACSAEDKGSCFREWVAATSGWFGGALAFVTLLAIRRQIQLQQRQIEYQLGDSRPTMYAVYTARTSGQPMVRFIIENHNRRPFTLASIEDAATPPSVSFMVQRCFVNELEQPWSPHGYVGIIEGCTIPGRVEGHPTPTAFLDCSAEATRQPVNGGPAGHLYQSYAITAICFGILEDEEPKEVFMQTGLHLQLPWSP
ncbi:hypothetical protein [Rhizobium johnstonii]|uniref:hypothetical protein n=1 Tax=Rhizobium johnstonii TaxID=3019933 RepID=UPI003F9E8CC8